MTVAADSQGRLERLAEAYGQGVRRAVANENSVSVASERNHLSRLDLLVDEALHDLEHLVRRTGSRTLACAKHLEVEMATVQSKQVEAEDIGALGRMLFYCRFEAELPSMMSSTQGEILGSTLVSVANAFQEARLPVHSQAAADAAYLTYDRCRNRPARDEAAYIGRRAGMLATTGPRRFLQRILWASAGFGYRPWRLASVAAVIITVCSLIVYLCGVTPPVHALTLGCLGYLGSLGFGDIGRFALAERITLIAEGFVGVVINSMFVALLARKWFQV